MPAVGDLVRCTTSISPAWIFKVTKVNLDVDMRHLPIELDPFINLHLREKQDPNHEMFSHTWANPDQVVPVSLPDLCSLRLRLDRAINEYVKERSK